MIKNMAEEHVEAAYDSLLPHFPDFCGCETCRGDVLIYALNRVPPRYVNTREGSVMTEIAMEKDQARAPMDVTVMQAFKRVAQSPRCGRAPAKPG
jgi:competence protein ComFB